MINFISNTYDIMSQSIFGTIGVFVLAGMAFFFILMVLYILLFYVDYSYRPVLLGEGKVVDKSYESADTETYDEYLLYIQVGNLVDEFLVSKTLFDKVKNGDILNINYSLGRFRKSLYIKNINI